MSIPVILGSFPTQSSAPLAAVSLATAPLFDDLDARATRSYGATGLPPGTSIASSTGVISGTPSVAGTYTVAVTLTTSSGPAGTVTLTIVVAGAPSAAQNFYIDGALGNDAWDGSSAAFVSGTTGPWRTLSRANNVQPHASGHVDIWVAPGVYRNQVYAPAYSGTDNTHRIRLRVSADGIVYVTGPTSGKMLRALQIGSATTNPDNTVTYTVRNYISVLRETATRYFLFDGEVVFGLSSCRKGDDVTLFGSMSRLAYVNGTGVVLECGVRRTVGYDALEFGPSADLFVARIDWEQHGTAYHSDGADFGDMVRVPQFLSPGS